MMATNFCGRTRREMLWQTGGGFGAAALTGLLSDDGFFFRRSTGCRWRRFAAAPLYSQSKKRHLSLHVRRPQPHRHLRLQARHEGP